MQSYYVGHLDQQEGILLTCYMSFPSGLATNLTLLFSLPGLVRGKWFSSSLSRLPSGWLRHKAFPRNVSLAIKQIVDWDDYVIRNRASVQQNLADWCKKKDKLKWATKGRDPSNYTGDRLSDARTHVHFKYGLVAGRRNQITSDARTQALRFANRLNLNLRSYDAFVDIAEKLDSLKKNPNQTVSFIDFHGH